MSWLKNLGKFALGTFLLYYVIMFVMAAIVSIGLVVAFIID